MTPQVLVYSMTPQVLNSQVYLENSMNPHIDQYLEK